MQTGRKDMAHGEGMKDRTDREEKKEIVWREAIELCLVGLKRDGGEGGDAGSCVLKGW